jgi:hypothetical protein
MAGLLELVERTQRPWESNMTDEIDVVQSLWGRDVYEDVRAGRFAESEISVGCQASLHRQRCITEDADSRQKFAQLEEVMIFVLAQSGEGRHVA